MLKYQKQSLIDWQVTDNGKPYAWITKVSNRKDNLKFNVTFHGQNGEYSGYPTLTAAKRFIADAYAEEQQITTTKDAS